MSNPFTVNSSGADCGCQNGCHALHSLGCQNRSVCCKEKSDFQQSLETWTNKIKDTELQIRLLKDKFRKRPSSTCDSFKTMSKSAYEAKLKKYNGKIASLKRQIRDLKLTTKAGYLLRGENQSLNCPTSCGCC